MSSTSSDKEIERKIIHVDMDAFYASVEQRDNPELRGRPVIVGGKPNGRGVVAACSYEAREFGIHSAMPSAEAGRRCPHAVFVKPRFSDYQVASRQIHEVFQHFTHVIEPLSLDEAYLDVTSNTLFKGSAVLLAREIRSMILERTQLVASAGVSYNKFLAKIASDYDKPDGLYCIRPEQGEEFVAQLPVGKFHGVGKVTQARMFELGIHTGADLKAWPLDELEREFGKSAGYYYRAARGIDHRPVSTSRTRRSMGSERTFSNNIQDREEMLKVMKGLGDELLQSLAERKLASATINIKVRFGDFETLTRAYTHASGSINKRVFDRVLPFLLDRALAARVDSPFRAYRNSKPGVRLLGVAFSTLSEQADDEPQQLEIDV
ncbi:MAG: DNA polymerase IV [Granulosicoccus sp.]